MIYIINGITSILSGMGVGGGTLFMILVMMFDMMDIKEARVFNLAIFITIGIINIFTNFKKENVFSKENIKYIFMLVIGCAIGIYLNKILDEKTLKIILYSFFILIGIYEFFSSLKKENNANNSNMKGE